MRPLIYALGFAGGRLDHTLAVLHVMGRTPERPVILISADDASAIVPAARFDLDLPIGCRVSIMPLADAVVTVTGVVWPFTDKQMHPMGFTSPSNRGRPETTVRILAQGAGGGDGAAGCSSPALGHSRRSRSDNVKPCAHRDA